MVAAVTSYGAALRKRDGCIEIVEKGGTVHRFPFHEINELTLSVPCSLTSEMISECVKNGIPIMMTDPRGIPLWQVEPFQGGSTPLLRRKQLILSERSEGTQFVQAMLSRKLLRRIELLNRLAINRRDERGQDLRLQSAQINSIAEKILALPRQPIVQTRQIFLGHEGTAGRIYFAALSALLPPEAEFHSRERGTAAGTFNLMLNYGYGVLYREVSALCARAKLDPYIGVMHTDGWNRPTLVYDLVEPFRADVEQAVFFLFSRRRVHADIHFDNVEEGRVLSKEGKQLLMEALYHVWRGERKGRMEKLVTGFSSGLSKWTP